MPVHPMLTQPPAPLPTPEESDPPLDTQSLVQLALPPQQHCALSPHCASILNADTATGAFPASYVTSNEGGEVA